MRPLHPSAVPAWMIDRATRCREAGDWRGACAAARVAVGIDLSWVRNSCGSAAAGDVEDALRHLVPDLLRWHMPRRRDGLLRGATWAPLVRLPNRHALVARSPDWHEYPQRISLQVVRMGWRLPDAVDDSLLLLPERWDSRRTAELLTRCGGDTRLPLFTTGGDPVTGDAGTPVERVLRLDESGRHADAWTAAGFDLDVLLFEPGWSRDLVDPAAFGTDPGPARTTVVDRSLAWLRPLHSALPDAARRVRDHIRDHPASGLYRIELRGRCIVLDRLDTARPRARLVAGVRDDRVDDARRRIEVATFGTELSRVPRIPHLLARRPAELTGLMRGDLRPADLHPLVQGVLFPAREPQPPPVAAPRDTARVWCGESTHEVVHRDGTVVVPHPPAEIDRERVIGALGGRVRGCAAARDGWRDPRVRMPRGMRGQRAEFLAMVRHGDGPAVAAALDRGFDPHVRDERGRTLLHLLPWLFDLDLLPRLLAAGLDVYAGDGSGEAPMRPARTHGPPELVEALVAAGADRHATIGNR